MAQFFEDLILFFGFNTEIDTFPEFFKMIFCFILGVYIVLSVLRFLIMAAGNLNIMR